MDIALRRAVLDSGLSIVEASAAASGTPARLIGLGHTLGAIESGLCADLVVLDEHLTVAGVLASGAWKRALDAPATSVAAGLRDVTKLVQTNWSTGLDH
jgi:N-acetylglucosamine-6-phosphate deacetylase